MVGIYKGMEIVLNEQQILMLENNYEAWGCYLFEAKSEKREWCENAQSKIKYKKSKIQEQIDKVGKHLKEDRELPYSEKVKYYTEGDPFFDENLANFNLAGSAGITVPLGNANFPISCTPLASLKNAFILIATSGTF